MVKAGTHLQRNSNLFMANGKRDCQAEALNYHREGRNGNAKMADGLLCFSNAINNLTVYHLTAFRVPPLHIKNYFRSIFITGTIISSRLMPPC